MSPRRILHLVRAQRSAPAVGGDSAIGVGRDGRFFAPPGSGMPAGVVSADRVVALVFEHDAAVVW